MNRVHKIAITYFLWALPVIAPLVLPSVAPTLTETFLDHPLVGGVFGTAFGLWMLSALYVTVAMVISPGFREGFLHRLLRVKERDEREAMITASAAKQTFFSSIAVTILLLILTMFQVDVRPLKPEEMRPGGGTRMLSLGLKFSPWKAQEAQSEPLKDARDTFSYDFPVTSSGVLLILLVWQVGVFTWSCRKRAVPGFHVL
ncbi:MAG: hypothetical protein HUU37_03420 [Bdellovibrionales bacterium]|nr:hypothetical protein [Bdellovibrionales bacterium]